MLNGIIKLEPLIEYVKDADPIGDSLHGNSNAGRIYGKLAKELSLQIAEKRGVYVWGNYGESGWNSIYVGKAWDGKTSHLRARILEELKDEKHFLWRSVYTTNDLLAIGERHYPKMWFRYRNHWELALRKTGSTHIIWIATPEIDNQQVKEIESYLIDKLSPTANRMRPTLLSEPAPSYTDVLERLNELIYVNLGQ